jgi:tRNA-dihydrouridine synthase A
MAKVTSPTARNLPENFTIEDARRLSIAPMLDWTTSPYRTFMRNLTKRTLLYTEMVTTGAIIFGNKEKYLKYNEQEHFVALQLGGSDPKALAECAQIAEQRGYDEVNLNVGCPSDRVQNGSFGACLMAEPELVGECIKAMQDVVSIPVTVKSRIGIDDFESYDFFENFIGTVNKVSECETFIVHARNAILKGLSPKENREIPPLKYDYVYRIKEQFPDFHISINGGVKTLEETEQHLQHVDGVMIGREAYNNPYMFADVDRTIYGDDNHQAASRHQAIEALFPYIEEELANGTYLNHITRHLLGMFQAVPGARKFRRHLSENATKPGADLQVLKDALAMVEQ